MAAPDPVHGGWTTKLRSAAPVEFTLPDVPTPFPRLFAFPAPSCRCCTPCWSTRSAAVADGRDVHRQRHARCACRCGPGVPVVRGRRVAAARVRGCGASGAARGAASVPTFAFTAANSVAGRAQPDQVTTDDAFLILRYTGTALTGVAEVPAFAQTGMLTAVPSATMTAVTADQKLDATISPPAIAARYAKVVPRGRGGCR